MPVYNVTFLGKLRFTETKISGSSPKLALENFLRYKHCNAVVLTERDINHADVLLSHVGVNNRLYKHGYTIKIISYIKSNKKSYIKTRVQDAIRANMSSNNAFNAESDIVLYHGSRDGIVGNIKVNPRINCDFGAAFYAGTLREQAEMLISNSGALKLLYTIGLVKNGLNIYNFSDNITEWALYVTCNRGRIDVSKYKKLQSFLNEFAKYDVIIGPIADDAMSRAFNAFSTNALTIDGLAYCLSKVNLGAQYAFKTSKSCSHIFYRSIAPLDVSRLDLLNQERERMVSSSEGIIEYAQVHYRNGKLMLDLLEDLK